MNQKKIDEYDLVVIGGGPGGYAAAICGAKRGLSVAVIEKRGSDQLGGTCLNVGCIPTKYLLHCAKTWHKLQSLSQYGIQAKKLSFDWSQMINQKDQLIARKRKGLTSLMKSNHITVLSGHGRFIKSSSSAHSLSVEDAQGSHQNLTARHVIIATGSKIKTLPSLTPCVESHIYTSDSILNIPSIPKHLAVIGGGVIGMEFASLFTMMGSQITIIEAHDKVLGEFDQDCVAELLKCWKSFPVDIRTSTLVNSYTDDGTLSLTLSDSSSHSITPDAILVAVGRVPVSDDLGLEHVNLKVTSPTQSIAVDETGQTSTAGIYAIGDVTPSQALAHTATAEALVVIDHITSRPHHPLNYLNNPLAVYSYPELASVGYSQTQLTEQNQPFKSSVFPFKIMAKAEIEGHPQGFIKVLSDPKTTEILGVHMIGGQVTELISEWVLGKALETTLYEFARTIRPHPTLSETLTEVALVGLDEPLHTL